MGQPKLETVKISCAQSPESLNPVHTHLDPSAETEADKSISMKANKQLPCWRKPTFHLDELCANRPTSAKQY